MSIVETQETDCREATYSVPKGVRQTSSLLGRAGCGMRLKVSRDASSDVVELASRKCRVGSAPSCDVRVNEPGIAPIECLIFHGSKNNIVRWLDASRGFAGGEFFEDEILRVGDPLQIGPVELEVLIDEMMEAEAPWEPEEPSGTSEDRLAEYISRLERLEIQLHELQQASGAMAPPADATDSNDEVVATISALAAQLAALQARGTTDRDLWAGEKAEVEALLQSRLREFDLLQDEVRHLRDELVTVRSEYRNTLTNDDTRERLAEVSQTLAERTGEFERRQLDWERERGQFQRHLQANMERLEEFEKQLSEQSDRQTESELARQIAERRADQLQESVEKLSQQLAEQQQEYEAVRAQWEADRAALELELAEAKERLAQSATTAAAEAELREAWNRERHELQSQINESTSRLEETRQELESQRRQFHEEQLSRLVSQPEERSFDQPIQSAKQRINRNDSGPSYNPMDLLLAAGSLGDEPSDEFEARVRNFVSPVTKDVDDAESEYPTDQYGPATAREQHDRAQPFSDLQSAACLNDEVVELAFETASPASPVSTAGVLAKLGRSGVWDDDESDADDSNDSGFGASETLGSRYGRPQFMPVTEMPSSSSIGKRSEIQDDEEESIEAYMARLMNRVRATDVRDEPSRTPEPAVVRSPSTEYTEVKIAKRPDLAPEPEKFNPEEYKPRSQAPELADRMTAMRSLANDSARSAIASHAKRNWSSMMKLKLL
ncbi:MAG: hypothetical protein HYV60_25570, partial [Planctomycetia bacterium]|nr:hypothetical protein [Planctomycetia bacterium]